MTEISSALIGPFRFAAPARPSVFAAADAETIAQPPLAIPQHAKRQSEIIFSSDLPPAQPDARRVRLRHVPAVQPGTADQPIAGAGQGPVLGEIGDVVLDQNESRPPA